MNRLLAVAELGQSLWYDYIQRSLIWTGELHRMAEQEGLRGVTSNPSIFEKAIGQSKDYLAAVRAFVEAGLGAGDIYERIAVQDIQLAADVLRPVYERTQGIDGYVSLEVSPHLAHDTQATLADARRLWALVGRENVMIKVPATPEGVPAIEQLISDGINVNVTLLFAVDAYERVAEAYQTGLEKWVERGGDPRRVASVASFFVSRIDTLVDEQIDERLKAPVDAVTKAKLDSLRGKVAIANAKIAYQGYQRRIATARWSKLASRGARPQRLLWASTSTKNPRYRDVLYVEELIGPDTVNTVPEATWIAFRDHGEAKSTLGQGLAEAQAVLAQMAEVDLSLRAVTDALLADGVTKFADAFDKLLGAVEQRRQQILGPRLAQLAVSGADDKAVKARLETLRKEGYVRRMWAHDARLYGASRADDPAAAGFMGWLDVTERMLAHPEPLLKLARELAAEKVESVVLMGMGGSSLAPDVFARTFGKQPGHPALLVLDSTVPAQVAALEKKIDPARSVFIVASKSGTTTEPLAFDQYFFDRVKDGRRFVAITDPGSKLEQLARARSFRAIFPGEPEIGGRYSALSNFGIVPAAAMGLDVVDLLTRARRMMQSTAAAVPPSENPGVRLGALLGDWARAGRDKLTIVSSPKLRAFGAWLEQLIAESTGKNGLGIIPIDGEPLGVPGLYGADRVFAHLAVAGEDDPNTVAGLDALRAAGHPVVTCTLRDVADLVQEMVRWEVATATAGHVLGINPFDQPNVQESKDFTKRFLDEHAKTGKLPEVSEERRLLEDHGVIVYADPATAAKLGAPKTLADVLRAHLGTVRAGDYVAINAYLEMNAENEGWLQGIRRQIRDEKKVATTLGFGPRFLHSTGQIHKGGPASGVFLQLTAADAAELPIPGMSFGFGTLKTAQANGDFAALAKRGRRLVRLHLSADVQAGLRVVAEALGISRLR
ncbi:MAG: bifunctional transaldolase/phosoglucose isomerase [Deltaproteobacteria bacterium]|nr:bifunctional transaldolase/phosoglucose isomerase [Deltaproteobacteria bacterium]